MKRSGKKLWPWDRKRERAGERKRVSLINTRERESRRRKREGLLCLERVRETTAQLSEEEWGAHFPLKHHSLFLSSTFLLFLVLFWSSKSLCCAFPWKSCERRRKDWWSNREERKNEPEGCIFSLCTSLIGWSTVGQCWGFQLDVALVHATLVHAWITKADWTALSYWSTLNICRYWTKCSFLKLKINETCISGSLGQCLTLHWI